MVTKHKVYKVEILIEKMAEGKKASLAMRIGFSVAGALGLASLCGCTEEEAILGRVAIAGVSANPRVVANPEASAWAGAFSAGSQAQLNSINAGKMGTTVNVNNNSTNGQEMTSKFTIIKNIHEKEVIIENWKYEEYVREHPEDYVDGYKAEVYGNGRWQLVYTTGKMRNK